MSDKDIARLMEIAEDAIEKAKNMSKREAIDSLNQAGILTKKGKFKKAYTELEQIVQG